MKGWAGMNNEIDSRRIAIVHDWLPLYGGAERVLEQMLMLYPQADLFTLVDALKPEDRAFLRGKKPYTSLIQQLPLSKKYYRQYFPFMPLAVEQFDLSSYDIILTSSYAFAKGVLTGPNQLHICYCHSPIRYAWDMQNQYLSHCHSPCSALARMLFHYIRIWDIRTTNGVNAFIANSRFISRRIKKAYGRESHVIHPPVDVDRFTLHSCKDDFYLTAARFVPYKRIDLIVKAFARMPEKKLIVVGDGPEFPKIRRDITSNISLVGHQSAERLLDLMQHARAFVFAAEEDFGITLVEAQACGTPVVAFGRGGARDAVIHGETGILFGEQTEDSLIRAIKEFETSRFNAKIVRKNAERFSIAEFRTKFAEIVEREYAAFSNCF